MIAMAPLSILELFENPKGKRYRLNKNTIRQETNIDPDAHEKRQETAPLNYTQNLVETREINVESLKKTIREHISPYMKGKNILEIGPGAEDMLYDTIYPAIKESSYSWTALDINPQVTRTLEKKYYDDSAYKSVNGTMRDMRFEDESFDVVCGICVLDSIIDINNIAKEIYRVLKPNSRLIHIQDLPPSAMTVLKLASDDNDLSEEEDAVFYELTFNNNGGITHIQLPGKPIVQSHQYLHEGLKSEFEKRGFSNTKTGLKEYSENAAELYVMSNAIIRKEFSNQPTRDFRFTPHYSYLIMQK